MKRLIVLLRDLMNPQMSPYMARKSLLTRPCDFQSPPPRVRYTSADKPVKKDVE